MPLVHHSLPATYKPIQREAVATQLLDSLFALLSSNVSDYFAAGAAGAAAGTSLMPSSVRTAGAMSTTVLSLK